MRKNYYDILGISPTATQAMIKPAAQAKAHEINEAFRVLNDPEQRRIYDESLKNPTPEIITPATENTQKNKTTAYPPPQKITKYQPQGQANLGGSMWQRLWNYIKSYFTIEAPSSMKEIIIFTLALLFCGYMLYTFFTSPPAAINSAPSGIKWQNRP